MIIIYEVVKNKTGARGYWINEKGKLFKDNINFLKINNALDFEKCLSDLFLKGEEAVFYVANNKAYIENKNGNIDILTNKRSIYLKHLKPSYIKQELKKTGGFTIYRNKALNDYIIESWTK